MKNLFIIILFIVSTSACTQSNEDNVKYKRALAYIEGYHSNHNKQLLEKALIALDSTSLDSTSSNYCKIANTKISLYLLLEKYKEGIAFVDVIPENRFYKTYQKEMYLKSMLALNERDTLKRDSYYQQAILAINSYLSNNPTDEQALTDLFYIRLRFEPRTKVLQGIDEYLKTDSNQIEFFKLLRQSIQQDTIPN
ncbi:MAG: hypothetical protein ACK5LF_21530 [Bacteroides xylanisolvens]